MYSLPDLPYDYDALKPHIDEKTMKIHHTKHHQGYVNKLNEAVDDHADLQDKSIEDLLRDIDVVPMDIRTAVRNSGGGHANHSLFWEIMSPDGGGKPSGELADALNDEFGSIADFKDEFTQAALSRFGSGWAWLIVDEAGDLKVESTPNQDSPYMRNQTPILGLDVWEHAYYLNYQNKRAEYIEAWWEIVNWNEVAQRFSAA